MLDRPVNLTEEQVVASLRARWGIEAERVEYAPVGYGGYHWTVDEPGGARWFVTADPRVGEEYSWILASYRAAATLREHGLEFVLPPTPDRHGELRPDIAPAWALAVYPYIDLTRSAAGVGQLIAHYQVLADQVVGSDDSYVITHDEPHAGNAILDTAGALHFIDWDATFVAPREMGLRILLHGRHEQPLGLDNRSAIATATSR